MWAPVKVTAAPDVAAAYTAWAGLIRRKVGLASGDTSRDVELTAELAAALAHAEVYCGIRILPQTVDMTCSGFCDLARLPAAPLRAISAISYVDPAGAPQTLGGSVYEAHLDGLMPSIALAYGAAWPAIRPGSRITVTATAGYATPAAVPGDMLMALILLVAGSNLMGGRDMLVRTEATEGVGSTTFGGVVEVSGAQRTAVEALLANYRCWPL